MAKAKKTKEEKLEPIGEIKIPGNADIAATNPAKAGESVLSRINQGIVIINIELPKPDEKFDI